MSHSDNRTTCGTTMASSCVFYTGVIPSIVNESSLPFIPNIDDIIISISNTVKDLKSYTSLIGLEKKCLDSCNCGEENSHLNILQSMLNTLCDISTRLEALEKQDILAKKINIDLGCFNSPCINNSTNEHTLLEIIALFSNEICTLKNI